MILGWGLLTSAYGTLLAISPVGAIRSYDRTGLILVRTISLIILAAILFEVNTLTYMPSLSHMTESACVFLDGTIKCSSTSTYLIIFIMSLALIIMQLGAEGATGTLTSRISGEVFLVMLTNLVAITYVLVAIDWLVTVVAWELFNLSLYLLVSMHRTAHSQEISLSSSVKYFLLSAYTTTFLLLSIALLYGLTGTTSYDGLIMIVQTGELSLWPFYLMMFTFLFKLGAAPLHSWAPDLYDSLPPYITLWLLVVPKTAVLFLLLQLAPALSGALVITGESLGLEGMDGSVLQGTIYNLFLLFGVSSMVIGSIGLSSQWRMRRFLAYSSIANLGFILTVIESAPVTYYYITIYMITTLIVFMIILSISVENGINIDRIDQLSGLHTRNPGLAYALAICFFSLAGTPPLIGFYPKLAVITMLLNNANYAVLIVLVIASVLSACNYLSVIITIHLDKPTYYEELKISYRNALMISVGIGLIIVGGVYESTNVLGVYPFIG
uniref:NADH-ubiquinone oxidoreductase chain 2 n=1 Tax=Chytriomyces confervae TaxID=246404 RepID=A0A4P8NPA2_9FUNG|nr:NADH dehydrogenase subunit 2 [Chytriomyces confervae]QCQ69060.1 NADH dehydrogenase subunit 2 [Chytriomyces confervae]